MSDWNCIRKLFATAPPSRAQGVQTNTGVSLHRFQHVARVWGRWIRGSANNVDLEFTPARQPKIAPRAYGSQYGAPRPVNAGTTYTPLVSFTLVAKLLGVERIADQLHFVAQPLNGCAAMNTAPSSAPVHFAARTAGDGGQQAVF